MRILPGKFFLVFLVVFLWSISLLFLKNPPFSFAEVICGGVGTCQWNNATDCGACSSTGMQTCTGTCSNDGSTCSVAQACTQTNTRCIPQTGPNAGVDCKAPGMTVVPECGGGSECIGKGGTVDGVQCYYCAVPTCTIGEPDRDCTNTSTNCPGKTSCVAVEGINIWSACDSTATTEGQQCLNYSCSIGSQATGDTTGTATITEQNNNWGRYDRTKWYLNGTYLGDNTSLTYDFSSLVSGTSYTVLAERYSSNNWGELKSCGSSSFTPGGTCSLTANGTTGTVSIISGNLVQWNLTSSPDRASAVWRGTNNGVDIGSSTAVSPYPPSPWTATYVYNNTGSNTEGYTRYVEIKDSGGTVKCTTRTVTLNVLPFFCPSVSPSSLSLIVGGSGQAFTASGNVTWGSLNTSIATVSPTSGTSTTVSPVNEGQTTVTAGAGSACTASMQVAVSATASTTACPRGIAFCGDSAGGGITGACSSGIYPYVGNPAYDEWCDAQKGLGPNEDGYYCYTCSTTGPGPSPSPIPITSISAGLSTTGIFLKGPFLLGRIFQDINLNYSIDSLDKLIEKVTSVVSGNITTTSGLGSITGRVQNVLTHGAAIYHMWTNDCSAGGCTADQRALQEEIVTGSGAEASSSLFIPVTGSRKCTYYVGLNNPQTYTDPSCSTWPFPDGGYNRKFVNTSTPFEGIYQTDVGSGSGMGWYSHSSQTTKTVLHTLSSVKSGSCITGCTLQSKVTFSGVNGETHSGSWPAGTAASLNPDGTCFLVLQDVGNDGEGNMMQAWNLAGAGCNGNTCSFQNYTFNTWSANNGRYQGKYYEGCTRYTFNKNRTEVTPWSVSFTSPIVVGGGSLAVNNWYNLFDIKEVASCSYNSQGQTQVNPSDANQYCTCQLMSFNDGASSATFDCNFPLKPGRSFGDAPAGDYIFEITASTTNPIGYTITAGGTLAQGSQSPSGGKLSIKFNVPSSAIGQRINVALNQTGRDREEVVFGAPGLYPLGWYEANINFARSNGAYLDDARIIDPPDDYPYTIGMIPPAGNYCSRTSNLEQCYLTLTPSELRPSNISQVDFLLGNIKAGAWFQVKDADLQVVGSLISRIPSPCKIPKCMPSFDLSGTGGFPGVPAYSAGNPLFGSGTVSDKGWLAKSGYSGRRYNYQYFKSQVASSKLIDLAERFRDRLAPDGSLSLNNDDLRDVARDAEPSFAVFSGKLTVSRDTNLEGKKLVLFVGGDLSIKGRVNLTAGEGFFAAIVGGSINIDPAVISQNPNQYGLEGIFLADGAIHTGTNNPVPLSGTPDGQLYIKGVLAGWQGVILERDLDPLRENGANNDKPAETIEYAPDLILSLPKELQRQGSVWREIAP